MTQLPDVFNASSEEKMGDFEPLPAGWYLAEVVKSELKTTKAKNGKYINLRFKIIDVDEEIKKRYVFQNLNIINPNPTAVEIARKELATICEAMGLDEIEDTEELHEIPLGVMLKVVEATAQWPAKNEIANYCSEAELNNKEVSASKEDDVPF